MLHQGFDEVNSQLSQSPGTPSKKYASTHPSAMVSSRSKEMSPFVEFMQQFLTLCINMQIQNAQKFKKLSLCEFLKTKTSKTQSVFQLTPPTNRTYITTYVEDDPSPSYRMQKLLNQYKQMETQKSKTILHPKDKEKKINNFMRRMEYFESVKEQKRKIKRRLKEIYDDKNDQILYYPVSKSRKIDFSEDEVFYLDEYEYEDLKVGDEETISAPFSL